MLKLRNAEDENIVPGGMLYQLEGERKYFALPKVRLRKKNWDAKAQRAVHFDKKQTKADLPGVDFNTMPTVEEIKSINRSIEDIEERVRRIENRFIDDGITFTAEMVMEKIKSTKVPLTKKAEVSHSLIDYVDVYVSSNKSKRKKGSMVVFGTLKKNLENFAQKTGTQVAFDATTHEFMQNFQNYLIEDTKLINTTINKRLSTLKTLLNYAKKNDKHVNMGYKGFELDAVGLEVIALTLKEFNDLYDHDFKTNWRWAEQRDVFCFSCVTGLRYSDLKQLSDAHIKEDAIIITVIKKGQSVPLRVPLNKYSREILGRYKGRAKPLPVISNQKMNAAIKQIAKKVKINDPIEKVRFKGSVRNAKTYQKHELISAHTGRKTFVTLSLERGMSAEETMEISGHADYNSFKRYVKIDEARKATAMAKWDA